MKKLLSIIIVVMLAISAFAGCTKKETTPPASETQTDAPAQEEKNAENTAQEPADSKMKIALLKGPTAMGAVMLMNETENGKVFGNYNFEVLTTPDEVTSKLISGEVDVAAVPVNLASAIYNKDKGSVQIAAINTLGTLYILENGNTIQSLSDLSGKTIYSTGQGAVPEYVLQYVLNKVGVTDCKVEFMQTHAELAAAVASGKVQIAMLPEPFASVATSKNSDVRVALDIAKCWDEYSYQEEDVANTLPMGCIVVRKEFVNAHEKEFSKFLDEYDYFIEVTNDDPQNTAKYVVSYGILDDEAVAAAAIPNCNITFIEGSKMLRLVENFLNTMYEANPKSIGGAVPDEEFYYVRKY
ncbi:MAG: PhnD/SsuA/transferrin family substrate-binding protein [Lachnospiraceae bacterium]|nr:PhnD/SsuA/transferrin family substrate-binding protein [Lachnospiraceae bacterium]